MKFSTNPDQSKAIEIIEKDLNNIPISLDELKDKLEIMYNKENDVITIKCDSNLIIHTENSMFISKNDTVIISGEELGLKGKIYLNPVLQKIKKLFRG